MEFQVSDLGVASKVTLSGRLDAPGVDKIETKLTATVVPAGRPIVVDCSGVTFVSSIGIRLLITTARALNLRKAKMILFGAQPLVKESFDHVSLDHLIPIAADETAALELPGGLTDSIGGAASGVRVVDGVLRLEVTNGLAGLEAGRLALSEFLTAKGVGPRDLYRAELAFEELVVNVIRHAASGDGGLARGIAVTGAVADHEIVLTVEDDGPPFDPTRHPRPPRPSSIEDATPGGLGVWMVRDTADRVDYERRDGRNRVTVVLRQA